MAEIIKKLHDCNGLDRDQWALFALFDDFGIAATTYEHPAIFTVEEGVALDLPGKIPGQHGKSLFLKNAIDELWLVVACEDTRVDLKKLSQHLQTKRFSFGKPELMYEILKITPGSVTPFALMNDTGKRIKVVIDEKFRKSEHCVFHPLRNTHSTVMRFTDLLQFMHRLGFNPYIMPLA